MSVLKDRAPTRTPEGVDPSHKAFRCDDECDNGLVSVDTDPSHEDYDRCKECGCAGRYNSVACSECCGLISAEDVRSEDNAYVYCEGCTEILCELEVA